MVFAAIPVYPSHPQFYATNCTNFYASFDDPSGFMSAYHQNASCDPYTPRNTTCRQGNYVEYAIEVLEAEDVIAGLKFAQEKNVRLVVKNTGHEYVVPRLPAVVLGLIAAQLLGQVHR